MAILTIKLSTAQRDAVATAVRNALHHAVAVGSKFAPDLREALAELTERSHTAESGSLREYTAMTENRAGGTEAVTIKATSADDARARLHSQGYHSVRWVL